MDRNSPEYKKLKLEYEAKELYKKQHPEEYPWWAYFQFGFHNMTYMTDAECREAVQFYHLFKTKDKNGNTAYERHGRQPIYICLRSGREGKDK